MVNESILERKASLLIKKDALVKNMAYLSQRRDNLTKLITEERKRVKELDEKIARLYLNAQERRRVTA